MKRTLLVLSTVLGSMSFAQDCQDLFISEYVEGWSNNKALEIYNPTANTIDLSQYMVIRYSNGASSATPEYAVQLTGSIAPYDVHVGVLDKQDPGQPCPGLDCAVWDSLAVRADAWYSPDYAVNKTWYWNGNDAIVLAKGTPANIAGAQLVDVFGKIGEDPGTGWTSNFPYVSAGDTVTEDHSMIRKATILKGETNPTIAYFNPLLEYDSIPAVVDIGGQLYGNWFSLGTHSCNCAPASVDEVAKNKVSVFPNPSNGEIFINGITDYSTVLISNSLGQLVKSIDNNSKSLLVVDLSDRKGVYFVKLTDNNGNTITKKVIIK